MSSKTLFSLTVLFIIPVTSGSSSTTSGSTHSYDISSASALRKLYNSGVYKAERMIRPLEGMSTTLGPLSHSGVRLTLADGSKWLVHKGENFGEASNTIVVDARHMSDKWIVVETKDFKGCKKVSDFVYDGGSEYNVFYDNCHQSTDKMMAQ